MTVATQPAATEPSTVVVAGHVEHVMGTVFSFVVRDADPEDARVAIADAARWLHEIDERFSPYLAESEISRIADGTLAVADAHPDVRAILAMCDALRVDSGGVFDAWRWSADGRLDPSGVVKGWATQRAADRLAAGGCRAFAIDAGGDVLVAGGARLRSPWRIGIRHPDDPGSLAAVIELADGAVATSGTYERGDHLRRPDGGSDAAAMRSLTVIGPDLIWADAYATAAFLMGRPGLAWVADHDGYEALAVIGDRVIRTPGSDRYLATG